MNRSNRLRAGVLASFLGVAGICAGCGETQPSGAISRAGSATFASRTLSNTSLDEVRPVAARVFRQYFRLDPDASSGSVLVSRPTEVSGRGEVQSVRDALTPSPNRRQQIAELRMREDGSGVALLCRVQTQRLDTVERAAFARERGDDRPTETPIDRLGGATPNRREEWVNVGRDRKAETLILDSIARGISTTQPTTGAP